MAGLRLLKQREKFVRLIFFCQWVTLKEPCGCDWHGFITVWSLGEWSYNKWFTLRLSTWSSSAPMRSKAGRPFPARTVWLDAFSFQPTKPHLRKNCTREEWRYGGFVHSENFFKSCFQTKLHILTYKIAIILFCNLASINNSLSVISVQQPAACSNVTQFLKHLNCFPLSV